MGAFTKKFPVKKNTMLEPGALIKSIVTQVFDKIDLPTYILS